MTCYSSFDSLRFTRCKSGQAWRQAVSVARDGSADIPLPPELTDASLERLRGIARALAARGPLRSCPVDIVIASGVRADMAGRLFAWLTGSPLVVLRPDDDVLGEILRQGGAAAQMLICRDAGDDRAPGLAEISSILSGSDVAFGFLYPFDAESAIAAALKAGFEHPPQLGAVDCLIDSLSPLQVARRHGDIEVVFGNAVPPAQMQAVLAGPSAATLIVAHGNGYDYDLGSAVLCCIDGSIVTTGDPLLYHCYRTGICHRRALRIDMATIRADLLVLATCWGVFDGAVGLDHSRTAFARMLLEPGIGAVITTAAPWMATPQDGLRLHYALAGMSARSFGSARRLLFFRPPIAV